MLVSRLEGAPRNDVNPNTEEILKILEQADVIKKRGTRLEVHQQIQVAVRASLSPGDGAEHGDPMSPALLRDAEDLWAAAAQPIQCQHVIPHPSRVSPDDPPAHDRPIFRRLCGFMGVHGGLLSSLSTWLNSGIYPTQVAEWAGHGVDVLLRIYAKCVVGQDELAKRRISEALRQA